MSNERQQSSFTAEVRAKPQHHKFLIGKNGASIKEIRDQTGARIIFPGNNDDDKEVITIIGKEENVLAAKAQLEAIIKNNGMFVSHTHTHTRPQNTFRSNNFRFCRFSL